MNKLLMKEKVMTKKPVAVVLTDTHLKTDNLDLVFDIFKQAFEIALELKVDYVMHGGDFFTNRVGQSLQTLLMMRKILNIFKGTSVTLVGISGNHDKTAQDSEDSYLDIFSDYPNFKLIRNYEIIKIGKIGIGLLPFFTQSYKERLKKIKVDFKALKCDFKFLITHIAFDGVRNNDGSIVIDAVSPKDVKNFDKVLVGHYHDSSKISNNIHYIGSAYQNNYGENSEDKGFTIINSDGSLEFENSKFPKYIKVKLDASADISTEMEAYSGTNDNVRFIFQGKKEDFHKVDQSELSALGIECKFEINDLNEEIVKAEAGDFTSFDRQSVTKLFLEYCKIQEIKSKQRNRGIKLLLSS